MRRLSLPRAIGCVAAAWGVAIQACSSTPSSPSSSDGGLVLDGPAVPEEGGSRRESGSMVDAAPPSAATLGSIAIVDEPDTPCAMPGGTPVLLYRGVDGGSPSSTPVIEHLDHVGSRRFAGDLDGFVSFDSTGANPSSAKTSVGTYGTVFASEGTTVGAVGSSYNLISYRRFDGLGAPLTAPLTLATRTVAPPGLAMAGGAGASVAIWADGRLYGAGVTASGAVAAPAFTIGNVFSTLLSTAITFNGSTFAVFWSDRKTPLDVESWFALVSPAGVVSAPVLIASTHALHRVVHVAATPTGYAVALDASSEMFVLTLDPTGNPSGSAHRLLGAAFTWDVVSQGNELGVMVNAKDNTPRFRPLDATGKPIGNWVCFTPLPCDDAALDKDGIGYAAVYRTYPGYDVTYRVFDHVGTGP